MSLILLSPYLMSLQEHMFFEPKRIDVVRQMILAEDKAERIKYLDQMFEFQRQDMREILTAMSGYV